MQRFIKEAARYLGYGAAAPDEAVVSLIGEIRDQAEKQLKPKSVTGTFDISTFDFRGKSIASHLSGAHSIILFAATLGAESERMSAYYQKTDLQKAVVFDAVCNVLIEDYCDSVCRELKKAAAQNGRYINTRFSPGYGDFSIEYQKLILDNLNAGRRIGLSVTDNSLLIPQKSVTAVIGVFDSPPAGTARGCASCNMKDKCKMKGEQLCSGTEDFT